MKKPSAACSHASQVRCASHAPRSSTVAAPRGRAADDGVPGTDTVVPAGRDADDDGVPGIDPDPINPDPINPDPAPDPGRNSSALAPNATPVGVAGFG